ncbi:MAG: phospholipase A [Rhodocyclaceae bacterium]|nr:phospholipase A [Rhodocyclaceae bacterium]
MNSRLLFLLVGAACAAPTLAPAADAVALRAGLLACTHETDERLEACVQRLARSLDSDNGKAMGEQFREQWSLAKIPPAPTDQETPPGRKDKEVQEMPCSLCAYRPSYIIARNTSSPNAWPFSPSAGHAVTSPVASQSNEIKYQISFKSLLFQAGRDDQWQVWAAYTQQSHWQLFNGPVSRPFRETNYEPEAYVNRVLDKDTNAYKNWNLNMVGVGVVHQSNGQSNPLSRSWNRTYLQGGFAWDDWTLLAKVWKRWSEPASDDDNPGIENYMGRGEATFTWAPEGKKKSGGSVISLRLRHSLNPAASHGSALLEYSRPITEKSRFRWFFQAFRGYGESMLDYNHLQTTLGGGVGILNW